MAFNAEEFRKRVFDKRPLSPAFFEVEIPVVPNCLKDYVNANSLFRDLSFKIHRTDIPTRQFETMERRHNGPQRVIPYGLIYASHQMEIIEDELSNTRAIFDTWMWSCFNELDLYKVKYYDDIIAPEVNIKVYNSSGEVIAIYRLKEVYPINVGVSQLAWDSRDQFMTIPVEFSYREFVVEYPKGIL